MILVDGESVCATCGIVDDSPDVDSTSIYDSSPAPNLFLSRSLGTGEEIPQGRENAAVKRFFRGGLNQERNLSRFSNACQKLQLYRHIQHDAWRMFQGISKQMPQKMAEHACLSIFHTCRRNGISTSDDEIIEAVKVSFGRKNLPSMAKIIYQHMSVLKYDGQRKNEDKYYFNLVLKKRTEGMRISKFRLAKCKRAAWFFFTEIYTFDDNYRRRARMAVDGALGMTIPARRQKGR